MKKTETKPLEYDRKLLKTVNPNSFEVVTLDELTDEEARDWARNEWDGKFIGYAWHPAIQAACEELAAIRGEITHSSSCAIALNARHDCTCTVRG